MRGSTKREKDASVFSTLISIDCGFVTLTVIDSGASSSSILVECPEIRENLTSLTVSLKSVAMKVMDLFLNYRSIVCFRNHRFRAHSLLKDQLLTAPCLEDMDTGPSHAVSPSVMNVGSEEISISSSEVIDPLLLSVVE